MERIIINQNDITAIDEGKIERYFKDCLEESINALDSKDFESLEWYEDCALQDYFAEMPDLWTDNGEHLGDGFNMIWAKIIYNEDTENKLDELFENAREKVFNTAIEDFSDRLWEEVKDYTPYSEDNELSTNYEKWLEDGEMNSCFLSENEAAGHKIYKMYTNVNHDNCITVIFEDNRIYRY